MSGDNTRTTDDTRQKSPEQQATDAALSKVVQDLNAPGSKIDKNNSDLAALNENLQKNNILPNMEITGMQANNDQLPDGKHTEAVQVNENGQQINANYNPDTQQLTYERDPVSEKSKGPETVSVDMITGQTTITAPGDGNTTRTTTVANVGDIAGPTVITEGKPGEAPGKVLSVEYNDGTGNLSQLNRTFEYNSDGSVKGFHDLNGQDVTVPTDATDAKVDPKTGDLSFTQADGVQVKYSPDGSKTLTTPNDAGGRGTTVTIDGTGVSVQSMQNGQADGDARTYDNANPATVKLDPNGTISMDTVIPTGYGGHDPFREGTVEVNGQDYYRTGSIKIDPNGQETTITGTDGNQEGDITVVRTRYGGEVTSATEMVDGKPASLLDETTKKPLEGISLDSNTLHNHKPDAEVDPATGKVKSYSTEANVRVNLDQNGKVKSYSSNGFSFEKHDDGDWYYHQDGSDTYVPIDEPKMNDDGTVHTNENGFFINNGRSHDLNGSGQETGGSPLDVAAAFGRNLGHSLVDDTISSVTAPVGSLFGQDWETSFFNTTDPSNSSNAERTAAAAGSILSYFVPGFGEVKAARKLEVLANIGKKAAKEFGKDEANGEKDNYQNDESINPLNNWNWYNWGFN